MRILGAFENRQTDATFVLSFLDVFYLMCHKFVDFLKFFPGFLCCVISIYSNEVTGICAIIKMPLTDGCSWPRRFYEHACPPTLAWEGTNLTRNFVDAVADGFESEDVQADNQLKNKYPRISPEFSKVFQIICDSK